MHIEKLRHLIKWMTDAQLACVELKTTEFEVRLQRSAGAPRQAQLPPTQAQAMPEPAPASITASCCGHFHARHPSRDTPQVSPGQAIEVGDVIGVVKVGERLLAVTANAAGIAGDYLVSDGQLVDYGKPLLALATTGA